jgi:hypothetical protein
MVRNLIGATCSIRPIAGKKPRLEPALPPPALRIAAAREPAEPTARDIVGRESSIVVVANTCDQAARW